MQMFAISFVCLLVILGLHGSLARPKFGHESINEPAGGRSCRVADFQVQPDFNLNLFIGTWYHVAQIHPLHGYQRRSHYSLLENGNGISMRASRVTSDCHTFDFEALSQPEDMDNPAKMILTVPIRPELRENYWVLYTDYTGIAVIYSCNTGSLTESGTCPIENVKLWVIARIITLTDAQLQRVERVLDDVCLEFSALILVPKGCDESLGISSVSETVIEQGSVVDKMIPQQEIGGGNKLKIPRKCVVEEFAVHINLNVNKYLGTWYTVAQTDLLNVPYQRKAVYSLNDEGSIDISLTQTLSNDGECTVNDVEATAVLPEGSNTAKLLMNITTKEGPMDDYWVLYVDYDNQAIWYSCGARREDGTCYEWAMHLWVISRSPVPLSDEERIEVNKILVDVCIDSSLLKDVPSDCDGAIGLPTGGKNGEDLEEVISTEEIEISCIVDDFKVQDNFVVEKFLGEWHNIKYKNPSIYQLQTSFRSMTFSASQNKTASHMEVLIQDIKIGIECGIAANQVGMVWVDETDPAKLTISFESAQGQRETGVWNFWIMATDYDNYAIAYACHVIGEFGTCDLNSEELWVLSRTPTFDGNQFDYLVENAVQYVCMEPSDLVENTESCQTSLNAEEKEDEPVVPADFTDGRKCDPSVAEFGCCLLDDKPAVGPNYEGCPRAPPAIAGQPLPGEPLEIKEPGDCDDKIICKLGCPYGFATDVYGCEICACATQPKEQDTNQAQAAHRPIPLMRQRQKLTECEQQRNFMQNFIDKLGETKDFYLPVCDSRGLFEVTQCYGGTNVCWCVHPHTGIAIEC